MDGSRRSAGCCSPSLIFGTKDSKEIRIRETTKMKKAKPEMKRCFICNREVTHENGKAVDAASGEPKLLGRMTPGDGIICNDCDSITATETIKRDWLKRKRA
jgi:uncharacterized protein with PIN domain